MVAVDRETTERAGWVAHPITSGAITALLLAVVAALDYMTGPELDVWLGYFIAITYAAWALGRKAAIVTALVAEAATYLDPAVVGPPDRFISVSMVINIIVRLLVYLFVAEVTYRLVRSTREYRSAAQQLQRLNSELHFINARLDEDVRAAGLLQQSIMSFLPPKAPGVEVGVNVRYAGPTGGDLADAGALDGRIYACVADISGKGTPAALFTALIKHLLDEAHHLRLPVKAVAAVLDSALGRNLPPDRFVTLFYMELDPASGDVEYVNAGHLAALLYRKQKQDLEFAGSTASLIGLGDFDHEMATATLRMNDGDLLVLYTDGATEPKKHSGERLGDDFIRTMVKDYAHLPAQEIADQIVQKVDSETISESRDDLTIVCIKKTGSIPSR